MIGVIDARDVLLDPPGVLRALCDRIGLPFDAAMLSWPMGRRATDGVWARYWYAAVEASTGFAPYREPTAAVPDGLRHVLDRARPLYDELLAHRLGA